MTTVPKKSCEVPVLLIIVLFRFTSSTTPPFCEICDCKLSHNYYNVNCTTDVKPYLFEDKYWADSQHKTYPYISVVIQNSTIGSIDRQLPKSSVTTLVLRHCSIDYISDSTFSYLYSLEKLVLSHNFIETLHPKAFVGRYHSKSGDGLLPLRRLFLDHNKIETLDRDIFKYSQEIEILSLAHNPLRKLTWAITKAIAGLEFLKKLDLGYTQISSLPSYLVRLRNLRFLELSGNNFLEVPTVLSDLSRLKELHFNNNPVLSLSSDNGFANLMSIKFLYLCNMPQLQEIGEESFRNLTNLEELYLSDNAQLSRIHEEAFLSRIGYRLAWVPLKKLYLQNNKLSSVDMGLLEWDDLEEIDLTNNPWACDCDNRWMIADLYPNIFMKLNPDKTLTCSAPGTLENLTFTDVYENHKIPVCNTVDKKLLNESFHLWTYLVAVIVVLITVLIFWYLRRISGWLAGYF